MKRALVTGGSGGIGSAICRHLSLQGFYIYVHSNRNIAKAQEVADDIISNGGKAEIINFDVTNQELCETRLTDICKKGAIDVLVNNAGIVHDAPMAGMENTVWKNVINVSLDGFFNVTKPLLMPMIRNRNGRIINITSVTGITGNRGQVNYAAAKGGINLATKSLSQELASRNITVNAVAPGIIDTGMAENHFDHGMIASMVPMRRAGRAEEVATLVGYLASEDAGYITGQIISINGGIA